MTDHPIIFNAAMIQALLDGRKTQTRRVLKPQPIMLGDKGAWQWDKIGPNGLVGQGGTHLLDSQFGMGFIDIAKKYCGFDPGDRLWVRETWANLADNPYCDLAFPDNKTGIAYRATDDDEFSIPPRWRPSIHMPRWASRLTLIVTDVRVQRLQEITEDDAIAEGVERMKSGRGYYDPTVSNGMVRAGVWHSKATSAFEMLWDSIYGDDPKKSWAANPWVSALTFTVHHQNIDSLETEQ